MASYTTRVQADLTRWVEQGWVDPRAAVQIAADVARNEKTGISPGRIIALLAAIVFATGIVVAVWSTWGELPRVGRLAILAATTAVTYAAGWWLRVRRGLVSELLLIIGSAALFGLIVVTAQIADRYHHLSGMQIAFTFAAATTVVALITRSRVVTIITAATTIYATLGIFQEGYWHYGLLALSIPCWWVSLRSRAPLARHVLAVGVPIALVFLGMANHGKLTAVVTLALSLILLVVSLLRPHLSQQLKLGSALTAHAIVVANAGMTCLITVSYDWHPDLIPGLVGAADIILAAGTILVGGRRSRVTRVACYLWFVAGLRLIAGWGLTGNWALTLLVMGAGLGLAAWAIIWYEKRLHAEGHTLSASQSGPESQGTSLGEAHPVAEGHRPSKVHPDALPGGHVGPVDK